MIAPGETIGILGGGQLARMLALSGAPLGLRFLVMDAHADACAGQFAPQVVGDYRDEAALAPWRQLEAHRAQIHAQQEVLVLKGELVGGIRRLRGGGRLFGELCVVLGFVETRTMGLFVFCH